MYFQIIEQRLIKIAKSSGQHTLRDANVLNEHVEQRRQAVRV